MLFIVVRLHSPAISIAIPRRGWGESSCSDDRPFGPSRSCSTPTPKEQFQPLEELLLRCSKAKGKGWSKLSVKLKIFRESTSSNEIVNRPRDFENWNPFVKKWKHKLLRQKTSNLRNGSEFAFVNACGLRASPRWRGACQLGGTSTPKWEEGWIQSSVLDHSIRRLQHNSYIREENLKQYLWIS